MVIEQLIREEGETIELRKLAEGLAIEVEDKQAEAEEFDAFAAHAMARANEMYLGWVGALERIAQLEEALRLAGVGLYASWR